MGRVAGAALVVVLAASVGHAAEPERLRLFVGSGTSVRVKGVVGVDGDAARLAGGRLEGAHAGTALAKLRDRVIQVGVVELAPFGADDARVDPATSHASISRVMPPALLPAGSPTDADALHWIAIGPPAALPTSVSFESSHPDGRSLDCLDGVTLSPVACPGPAAAGVECKTTPPIRASSDVVDRSHPAASPTSLMAEVGGRISVRVDGVAARSILVGGPRASSIGPIDRFRAKLRVRVLRIAPGGEPSIGGDDAGALALARDEVETAGQVWGQCGVHFGERRSLDVAVVDPPPPHLVAVGCDAGLPASGGELAVRADKHVIRVPTVPGQTPGQVANALAAAVRAAGLSAAVSPNPRIGPGALATVDVLIRRADGSLVALAPAGDGPVSTDPTLGACLGEVDLADGLTHFTDFDAVAGTVEERSMAKAFDDGDPATIDVFVIPSFARTGRIGESFIIADGASIQNAIIIDRAAVRAGSRSFALSHELGHILLNMPGHPDDYGVDQPWALMDADAADPTIFGPRRLSVEECVRAVVESGPTAPVPMLQPWPLTPARSR